MAYKCNRCGKVYDFSGHPPYLWCPSCYAEMGGYMNGKDEDNYLLKRQEEARHDRN